MNQTRPRRCRGGRRPIPFGRPRRQPTRLAHHDMASVAQAQRRLWAEQIAACLFIFSSVLLRSNKTVAACVMQPIPTVHIQGPSWKPKQTSSLSSAQSFGPSRLEQRNSRGNLVAKKRFWASSLAAAGDGSTTAVAGGF